MDTLAAQKGFSVIEIMIALALGLVVISAMMVGTGVSGFGTNVAGDTSTITAAQVDEDGDRIAHDGLDDEQTLGQQDFNLVNATTSVEGAYQERISVVLKPDFLTKLVTVNVAYVNAYGESRNLTRSTLVVNTDNVSAPDSCNSSLSGDWSHPQLLNTTAIDIVPDTLTDLSVFRGLAYVTGFHTGTNNDFFVIDVSNPLLPTMKSHIDTGPGLAAVAIAYPYAFVANRSTTGQLQVIDISNPLTPVLKISKKVTGANGIGNSIYYYNHYVYLGLTANGAGPQLAIFDVSSSTNPVPLGTYALGHDVNAIRVKGNYAYVATPDTEELKIFDISDRSNIRLVGGSGVLPDSTANGKSVYVVGDTVYLGRTVGLSSTTKQLYVLSATTRDVDPLPMSALQSVGDSINDLIVRSNLAFLVTNAQLQIWSLDASPSIQKIATLPLGSQSPALACENNTLYAGVVGASIGQNVLKIIGPSL